ncbi:MAG: TetR/AcrR family transcriptional regulator [Peptoniphilus sp.]|nr:TetR/AcrR family transcriptional regulator [Peptoniphilus sp.]MDY3117986.1 TetR/AcrR family transcriptional regulator [Peptoniphilus sp.]
MAKATFEHLEATKKRRLTDGLRRFFEETPVEDINVSNVVKAIGIARGSFYQYFEDVDDCYFTVLKDATGHVHHAFFDLLEKNHHDPGATLRAYQSFLIEALYDQNLRNLYRPQFLVFEKSALSHGKNFIKQHYGESEAHTIFYMMAVFHELIKDSMIEDYSRERFQDVSSEYIDYLLEGIGRERL